jgi:hypothetical protein
MASSAPPATTTSSSTRRIARPVAANTKPVGRPIPELRTRSCSFFGLSIYFHEGMRVVSIRKGSCVDGIRFRETFLSICVPLRKVGVGRRKGRERREILLRLGGLPRRIHAAVDEPGRHAEQNQPEQNRGAVGEGEHCERCGSCGEIRQALDEGIAEPAARGK